MIHDGYNPLPLACRFNSCKNYGEEDANGLKSLIERHYLTRSTICYEHMAAHQE